MTDVVARYTLAFRDLASRGILKTANSAQALSRGLATASRRAAAASAAVVGVATLVNQNTAQQANLAASVGKTVAELQGITGVAKSIGLEFDNVVDIQEEVINKFGEMAAAGEIPKTAIEGLTGLGFAAKEFLDVAGRADINELIDRGLQSVASGARTVADVQSALDQIAGGEANKILGAALARNAKSVAELNAHYERLNFLTKEGETGAAIYTQRFADLKFTLSSLSREGFGRLGTAMAPAIATLTAFLVVNKDVINARLGDAIDGIGEAVSGFDWAAFAANAQAVASAFGDAAIFAGNLVGAVAGIVGPLIEAIKTVATYIGDELGIETFSGFEDASNLAIAAAGLMALKIGESIAGIVAAVTSARGIIGKGIVIAVAVEGINEALKAINGVIARKAELEGKGVSQADAGRLSVAGPVAGGLDAVQKYIGRPLGENIFLPIENAGREMLGFERRDFDFDAYEGAARANVGRATAAAITARQRRVEANRPIEVEVTTKIEGRIDGAEITNTETNAVNRTNSGSNHPARLSRRYQ